MALREIRILGDDLLRKKSREVEIVDDIETSIKFERNKGVNFQLSDIAI